MRRRIHVTRARENERRYLWEIFLWVHTRCWVEWVGVRAKFADWMGMEGVMGMKYFCSRRWDVTLRWKISDVFPGAMSIREF